MSDMMTQEEAINLLGWLKYKTNRDDDLEAIDMAIEALTNVQNMHKAEPTQAEKCEDCIHTGTNKDKITCKECASVEARGMTDVKRERIAKSLLEVFRSVWCDRESDCWPYFNCSVCEFEDGEECRLKQFIKHTKYETAYPQGAIKSEVEE